MEWYVLVSVCGLSVDVECERSIGVAVDRNIQHGYGAFYFFLLGPFYVWVYVVDVCKEWCDMVLVYGCDCVVCFSEPEEDDI